MGRALARALGLAVVLGVGAASGFAAAAVLVHYLVRHRHLRLRLDGGRLRVQLDRA